MVIDMKQSFKQLLLAFSPSSPGLRLHSGNNSWPLQLTSHVPIVFIKEPKSQQAVPTCTALSSLRTWPFGRAAGCNGWASQRHRQTLSNTRDSACHKGPINIWRQIHTCPVLWVILTLVSAFCLAANYAMLIPHHLIGNRRGLGMGQWGPGISPAKRGTRELCTGENSVLRNSLGSWDYQETQATMDNIG